MFWFQDMILPYKYNDDRAAERMLCFLTLDMDGLV